MPRAGVCRRPRGRCGLRRLCLHRGWRCRDGAEFAGQLALLRQLALAALALWRRLTPGRRAVRGSDSTVQLCWRVLPQAGRAVAPARHTAPRLWPAVCGPLPCRGSGSPRRRRLRAAAACGLHLGVGWTAAAAAGRAARGAPPPYSSWRRVLTAAVSLRHRTVATWHWALLPLDTTLVQIPAAPSVLRGCGASVPLGCAPEPVIGPRTPAPVTGQSRLGRRPGHADAACRRAAAVVLCAGAGTVRCRRWGFFPLPGLAPLMARPLPQRVIVLLKGGAVCMRRHCPGVC